MVMKVNRNKEILGGIEEVIEMEDIEVKEGTEEEIEEIVEIEGIEEIDGKIEEVMIDGKEEVIVVIEAKEEIDTIEEIVRSVIIDAEITINRIVQKNNIPNAHNATNEPNESNESNAHKRKRSQLKSSPVIIEQL